MAFQLHFPLCPLPWGVDSGSQLLSWTQDIAVTVPQALPEPKPKRKHSLLPVLIVLFLISYGLMALLAVEQDRTIASQRSLISQLFGDSAELSSLKGRFIQKQHAQAQAQAEARARSQGHGSSAQDPSTQTPLTQTPSTQDTPGGTAQSSHNASKLRKVPQRPPLGIADIVDGRRIVKTI
jgi:hypothetical protein